MAKGLGKARVRRTQAKPLASSYAIRDTPERESLRAKHFKSACKWLVPQAYISRELAEGLIRTSAWWLTHQAGPIEVPGDAKRVTIGDGGWMIEYGGGTLQFLIGRYIRMCAHRISQCFDELAAGRTVSLSRLERELAEFSSSCVRGEFNGIFRSYHGGRDFLEFGTHGIKKSAAANYLIEKSGLRLCMFGSRGKGVLERVSSETLVTPPATAEKRAAKRAKKPRAKQLDPAGLKVQWVAEKWKGIADIAVHWPADKAAEARMLLNVLGEFYVLRNLTQDELQTEQRLKDRFVTLVHSGAVSA